MPIRPRNISYSHSSGSHRPSQTSTPYLLSEDASCGDDSEFSFEVEEEIVQIPKERSDDISKRSKSSTRVVEQVGKEKAATQSGSDDMSIMSDDFSISVASETDGLISAVESSSRSVKKSAEEVNKQTSGSLKSVEHSPSSRRGNTSDDASTTSSKTAIQSLMEKLSSMGDVKSISSQATFVTERKQALQSDASSKLQSLKSKAVGSIDFAESIVKSHGDIEHGGASITTTSSSSNNRLGDGTMEGTKVSTSSTSRRSSRRKLCCIIGSVLIAAAGTVGALIALDVILKDKTAPLTESSETETQTTSYNDFPWYVDWDAFQCVMDCNGRPPCGGTKQNNDEESYASLEQCCLEGMGIFIDEHWTLDICMSMTFPAVASAIPTYTPTPGAKEATVVPTAGPQASAPSPSNRPEMFYADFSSMKCVVESTSRKAQWETGYETMSDCCGAYFGGDLYKKCMDGTHSEPEPTLLYYPYYGERNCVKEDSSSKQIWEIGYDTKEECCNVNFIWDKSSVCFRGEEVVDATTSPPTSSPTKPPTLRPTFKPTFKPTPNPTPLPTLVPTLRPTSLSPTRSPSNTPTLSPVIPGSPTRSPNVSPSSWPSNFPTTFPTVTPSISVAPTDKPSQSPSQTPTGPTPSPTGELELLRAALVKRSPISSENLFLEDSVQYRAMEWLVGNTLYASYPHDRKMQRFALSTLFYSLYGDDWTINKGWLNHNGDFEHECTWHGVSCTASGTILSIDLKANRVDGLVPDEVHLLMDVEYLGLSENKIRSISASLFSLPKLKVLDMHKNRLNEIPEGDYASSILEEVYLSYNGISSIPETFFQLRFVKVLWLANNDISSTLSGFGKMTLLEELDLESNLFYGSIPEEMFGLTNLAVLYLFENELTGQLPPGLSQMTSLTALDLHSNQIGGQIPTEIGKFSMLSELYLGNNNIEGQIPLQLYDVTSLTVVDISENYLNSTLGSNIGNLNRLTRLDLHDNYKKNDRNGKVFSYGIYGSIPESIGSLTSLQELRLDNNYVQGMLPPAIGDLQSLEILRLESNNFHGSIKAIANARNLRYVHLWSNYFSGAISSSIGQLSQVVELFLDDNEFSGFIPSEMGQLSHAKYIALGLNDLEGMIPPSFGMLSSLERLDLQGNNLTGEVPAELGSIKSLERIRLEGNQFFGDIPQEVCSLASLEFLSGNCETAVDSTIENGYWWSCNCCTVCDEL